jgi:hypothetical protein
MHQDLVCPAVTQEALVVLGTALPIGNCRSIGCVLSCLQLDFSRSRRSRIMINITLEGENFLGTFTVLCPVLISGPLIKCYLAE